SPPVAVLKLPVSLPERANVPLAVLEPPVVLPYSALNPSAVFPDPVVLLKSENQPCAVLFGPVVLKLSAWTFSAALLPLPRSSPFGGGAAWATGKSARQASARTTKSDRLNECGIFMVCSFWFCFCGFKE